MRFLKEESEKKIRRRLKVVFWRDFVLGFKRVREVLVRELRKLVLWKLREISSLRRKGKVESVKYCKLVVGDEV